MYIFFPFLLNGGSSGSSRASSNMDGFRNEPEVYASANTLVVWNGLQGIHGVLTCEIHPDRDAFTTLLMWRPLS